MKKQKNNFKYYIYLYFFSLFIIVNLYAAFNWTGVNDDANTTNNDIWSISGSVTSTVGNIGATNSGSINISGISSELFGDFSILSGNINLNNSISSTKCGSGEITYEISGNLKINSIFWGEMDLVQTGLEYSYYCPALNKMGVTFYSDTLGNKLIGGDAGILGIIFNFSEVSIKGITNIKGDLNELKEDIINGQKILNLTTSSTESKVFNLNKTVNKNISLITKNLIGETSNTTPIDNFINTLDKEKYYYYNYEGDNSGNDNSLGNKGKNLIIQNVNNFSSLNPINYQVPIKGKNTLIVKGGNIYINSDIYNENDNSDILVIVAKRDSINNQHGGNIYIHPDVTNIDAIIIAEGSLLSYDGTNVLNSKINETFLRRQLLIHGSVMTKNTIGENYAVYGTDEYIKNNGNKVLSNYYNLANLRSSNLAYASYDLNDKCGGDDSRIIIGTSGNPLLYAFAGKKECFYDDINSTSNLRTVDGKVNPLVVEYNSNIQNLKPFILTNK